jgi:uncharacterized protein YbjT (DUF2867 family)
MNNSPVLIVGKHAKTGRRVERRLQALGYATRGVSRSTSPAFDWQDPSTWRAALEGTESAWVTFYPDLAIPGAEQTIREFTALAREAGLRHLVLLSGRGEPGAERAEAVVEASGLDWNIVRASWFMQNFSESFMIDGILDGELVLPAGGTVEPFVDVDDIAEVAVAALTRTELRNRLFEVTGPRALSFAQCVAEISRAVGYPVCFTPVPVDDYIRAMRDQGAPEEMTWLLRHLFTEVFDGRNARPARGVEEALGRPATDFTDYVDKTLATGAWDRSGLRRQA